MKKVININFQGRVIPIEETAFELLQQYIESLRNYFAREEGRDEIINDIESRIAELFSERLKKGQVCITDQDVNEISASIGRPEDFEDDGGTAAQEEAGQEFKQSQQQQQSKSTQYTTGRGRLYRNTDDKILGGVCSGLANYLGIDPVILRILFVLIFAPLFWVYIILWVVLPGKSVQTNITKRLYRSSDDKVIAGVAGGLAAYFHIEAWIPRLIFALPLILALVSGPFDFFWNHWDFWGPKFITGSLGWTLFFTYVILWIAVPVAVTASEKLEMKGERVDINSIADTVKEDLKGFQHKAEKWSQEVNESARKFSNKAKEFGKEANERFKSYSGELSANAKSSGSGLGHALGVIFKALFMLIVGGIAVGLFVALMWMLFGGFNIFQLRSFVLEGFRQEALAWVAIILFLGVPILAMLTWLIRSIAGVKSNKYIGFAFGTLWTIGLICVIILSAAVTRNYRSHEKVFEESKIVPNTSGRLLVDIKKDKRYYSSDWFGFDNDDDWPFYSVNPDTLLISMVRVEVVKSKDSLYHTKLVKMSRGRTPAIARELARAIEFPMTAENNTLYLPEGFLVSRFTKWRNQELLLMIEVPVGKRIMLDRSLNKLESFDIHFNRRDRYDDEIDRDWKWTELGREYIMTADDGPRKVDDLNIKELQKGNFKLRIKDGDTEINAEINNNDSEKKQAPNPDNDYRYNRRNEGNGTPDVKDTVRKQVVI